MKHLIAVILLLLTSCGRQVVPVDPRSLEIIPEPEYTHPQGNGAAVADGRIQGPGSGKVEKETGATLPVQKILQKRLPAPDSYVPDLSVEEHSSPGRQTNATTTGRPETRRTANSLALLISGGGILSIAFLLAARAFTRRISVWASLNPKTARWIIAGTQLAAGTAAFFGGASLHSEGIMFTDPVYPLAGSSLLAAAILYPDGLLSGPLFRRSYLRAKIHEAAIFTSGTIMMACLGNQAVPDPAVARYITERIPVHSVRLPEEMRAATEHKVLTPAVGPGQDPPARKGKGWLVLLAVLVFAGLAYLLLALACSLSCAGAEAAAAVVGFGGGIALIAILVATIRGIYGKKRKIKRTLVPVEPAPDKVPGGLP
jgi:hypothetical protein